MKKKTVIIIEVVLILIMIISAVAFFIDKNEYKKADELYTQMNEEYIEITEETTNKDNKTFNTKEDKVNYKITFNYEELSKQNPEVEGYIYLHNSNISYPIVRHSDNAYYLTHDSLNNYSINGAIFMESTNEKGLDGKHSIIYGHNMNSGSMFADINKYSDENFAKKHTEYTIFNKGVPEKYIVVASFITSPDDSNLYSTNFGSDEEYQKWIDYCIDKSYVPYGKQVTYEDKTILLSTCTNTGNTRSVVVLKKIVK